MTAAAAAGTKAETASGSNIPLQNASNSIPQKPVASNPPSSLFTNGLLVASGAAFLTGAFGSLWYQGRQEKRKGISRAVTGASAGPSLQSLNDIKMAESLLKEGRLLGLKAFGIATALCLSSAALIVGSTRWALDVETIPEFSEKMRELFPKQKTKFVNAVVSADKSVFGTKSENESESSTEAASEPVSEEKDLDHEEDSNILGRIERELRRLEKEEQTSSMSSAPTPESSASPASTTTA
ncbi:hypothetical protein BG011_002936 [Mortierella polycephala]|uniref:Transmembrane protein 242 n=1 Tax=Mortierella polycephala TaxID=41804 RepID=A0A9P6QEP0_9FUNG|nr:hypothetical protein BG011_002936 [Mortierella polycephala]